MLVVAFIIHLDNQDLTKFLTNLVSTFILCHECRGFLRKVSDQSKVTVIWVPRHRDIEKETIDQFTRLDIVYVVLNILGCLCMLTAMLYNVFFLPFKQFDSTKPIQILKNIYKFFSFIQFDSTKLLQLLKTFEKNVYERIGCLHENYQQHE